MMSARKTIRTLFAGWAITLLTLVGSSAFSQGIEGTIPLVNNYDLDATTYIYCVEIGQNQKVWGDNILSASNSKAITSGSSTNVTLAAGPLLAFSVLTAGDEITFDSQGAVGGGSVQPLGKKTTRVVTAVNNSGADITINAALDLSIPAAGVTWTWRKRVCSAGTATGYAGGWVPMSDVESWNFQFDIAQIVVTGGIDYKVECRVYGYLTTGVIVIPVTNVTAVGGYAATSDMAGLWDECRFGFKIGSADDGGDLTTNTEKLGVHLRVVRR